ncbi:thrombospondin-3, partial [Clarias magur]
IVHSLSLLLSVSLSGFHDLPSRCQSKPCYDGVACVDVSEFPGFRCGSCPSGTTGNGTHCQDIDEVPLRHT